MEKEKIDDHNLIYFAGFRPGLDNINRLVIHAGTVKSFMENAKIIVKLDGKEVPFTTEIMDNNRSKFCYKAESILFSCEYQFSVIVPDRFRKVEIKVIFPEKYNNAEAFFKADGIMFRKMQKRVSGTIDTVKREYGEIAAIGWYADGDEVKVSVMDGKNPVEYKISKFLRPDIVDYFNDEELKDKKNGFELTFVEGDHKKVRVNFDTPGKHKSILINMTKNEGQMTTRYTDHLYVAWNYLKQRGLKSFVKKAYRKMTGQSTFDYECWIKKHEPSAGELSKQRRTTFDYNPLVSIVVPVYRPAKKYFAEMLKSVLNQTYSNFELCLADGSEEGFYMEDVVKKVAGNDKRVIYAKLDKNLGISGNTNKAIEMSSGPFIVLGDHDDLFRPDALYEIVQELNREEDIDVIYTDEDKFSMEKRRRIDPNFKPDFNIDMLRNYNYICHIFSFTRELYEKVGGFRSEFDGAQDYDMTLRCIEKARKIRHIPKVLYSWRCHENSTALNPEVKAYAFEAGTRAVREHFKRLGINATVSPMKKLYGYNRVTYEIQGNPKISIVIPSKDHTDDLDVCIRSIVNKQDYTNYEILIVENNSTLDETFEYYKKIEAEFDCVKVLYWKEGFNYSKINNFAIDQAEGEYILLLNNDTEMINKDCLRELISFATRPEVGIVGARLFYNDDTIQHAGVIIGLGGLAGHAFCGILKDNPGYFARAVIPQDYMAVTAACLMVRKSIFYEVNGLEEQLQVAFNDVDFCLKVWKKGYLVVYNPEAQLYHYESKSRGMDDTPEKFKRFTSEINFMLDKWKTLIEAGDPSYNPNLSLTRADFMPKE